MLTKITNKLENSSKKQLLKTELVSFGQLQRDDRNILLELTRDSGSLIDVRSHQIKSLLTNIAETGETDDIKMLLSIAKNLKFGYSDASPMGVFLNTHSTISQQKEKQNQDWSKLIQETISKSLEKNDSPQKANLTRQFKELCAQSFSTEPIGRAQISANPIFQQQTKAIRLRNKILETPEFNTVPSGLSGQELEEFQVNQQRIKRNMDYFLASSECPLTEKVKVLEKLSVMMSPDYQINEQLKDKKVKVLSEILNDIVVRTPDNQFPNIKNVSQRHHGMCSAISRARKAVAYEDKSAYVDCLMAELDNKPTMNVFDITKLGENKKIPVQKTFIDFNYFQKDGYRIIDASTLQWMHIAGTIGDGSQNVINFITADPKNYGMFSDSALVLDLPDEYLAEHNYLRALIKTKDEIKEYEEPTIINKLEHEENRSHLRENLKTLGSASHSAQEILQKEFPAQTKDQIRTLAYNILEIEKNNNHSLKVHPNESAFLKKQKISTIIKNTVGDVAPEKLEATTNKLYLLYQAYSEAKNNVAKPGFMQLHNKANKHYKKLFNIGAFSRVTAERSLNISENFSYYKRLYNAPGNIELTSLKFDELISDLENNKNVEKISKDLDMTMDKDAILIILKDLKKEFNEEIPAMTDKYLDMLGEGNSSKFLSKLADRTINIINDPETSAEYTPIYAERLKVSPSTEAVTAKFESIIKELSENEVSQKRLGEIASIFDIENPLALVKVVIDSIFNRTDLSEEEIEQMANKLGVEPYLSDIEEAIKKIDVSVDNLASRQKQISENIKAPTTKDIILRNFEKRKIVLSREVLDRLQNKFEQIDKYMLDCEKAKSLGLKPPAVKDVFKFEKQDLDILKEIATMEPAIKRHIDREYQKTNHYLSKLLEQLYSEVGSRKGHFWVGEEGHSGLFGQDHVRIAEQMTGKPYYMEEDPEKAIQKIKQKGVSGVSATNVYYGEHSGHAQYVADIKKMPVVNPKTGEIEEKEVLLHDNTWGPRERLKAQFSDEHDSFWRDAAGYERTNYGRPSNCGGPEGFILEPERLRAGLTVDSLKNDVGINKAGLPESKRLKKIVGETGDKYPIFYDLIVQGQNPKLLKDYAKLSACIYGVKDNSLYKLIEILKEHPEISIDTDKMEKMDKTSDNIYDQLIKVIKGNQASVESSFSKETLAKMPNEEKIRVFGISSRELFDSLPENHKLKLILRKISLYDLPYGFSFNDELAKAKSHQELDIIEDKILSDTKKAIKEMIAAVKKPIAQIKTIDDIKSTFYNSDLLISWINKQYNPASDRELIKQFIELKKMTPQQLTGALNHSTRAQLSIEPEDPYNIIQKIRAEKYKAESSFERAVFYDTLGTLFNYYDDSDNPAKKAEKLYRQLYVSTTYVDKKDVNKFKEEAFRKYQVRPNTSTIPIVTEEQIKDKFVTIKDYLLESTKAISALEDAKNMNKKFESILNIAENLDKSSAQNIYLTLKPLLKEFDIMCPEAEKEIKALAQEALKVSVEEFPTKFEALSKYMEEVLKTYPVSLLENNIKKSIQNTDLAIDEVVKSEMPIRYQGRFKELCNKAISSLIKDSNPESARNQEIFAAIEDTIRTKDLFNHPVEILHSLLNEIKHPNANKASHDLIMKGLTGYANRMLVAGDLMHVESRIRDSIENGNIYQFKNLMHKDSLVTVKDKKKINMDSSIGIKSLLFSLMDEQSGDRTLKLVVDSMGIGESVIKTLISGTNPQKYVEPITKLAEIAKRYMLESKQLEALLSSIINGEKIFTTKEEAIDEVISTIDKVFPQTPENKSDLVEWYKKDFRKYMRTHKLKSEISDEIIALMDKARYTASSQAIALVEKTSYEIDSTMKDLQDLKYLTNSISLPKNSNLISKNEHFQRELDSAIKTCTRTIERLFKQLPK